MNDKYINYNINPKNKKTSDCVIRALSTLIGKPIGDVLADLTTIYITTGYFINDTKNMERYLKGKGYVKHRQLKKENRKKYTGIEFCNYLNETMTSGEPVIAKVGANHVTSFVNKGTKDNRDYRILDVWDCSTRCVGNWWSR